jgi:putative ABC transport system ATP-binding protein
VLLMDEPTSALDPDASRIIERLARALADDGVPIILVSHDRGQSERLGDRVVSLAGGRVVEGS